MGELMADARIQMLTTRTYKAPPIHTYELVKRGAWRTDGSAEPAEFSSVSAIIVPYEFVNAGARLESGAIVQVGPYRMRVIDHSYISADYICAPDRVGVRMRLWRYKAERLLVNIYYRLLATARIWGLADWDDYPMTTSDYPSWRSVHAFGKLAKWLKV